MIPIMPYMEQDNLFRIYVNFGGLDSTPINWPALPAGRGTAAG